MRVSPINKGTVLVHRGLESSNDYDVLRGLKKGAPIDLRIDRNNNTLLHYYAKQAIQVNARLITQHIVRHLLPFGSNLNIRNNEGKTPLHYAGLANNPELINLLLKWGVQRDIRDEKGKTPYDLARAYGANKRVLWLLCF